MPIEWLDPWYAAEETEVYYLERELRLEIPPRHELFGITVSVIGRRKDRDDILLRLLDGSDRFAVVHLTWRGDQESDPRWPWTKIYENQRAWEEWGLGRDHDDWWLDHSLDELEGG